MLVMYINTKMSLEVPISLIKLLAPVEYNISNWF